MAETKLFSSTLISPAREALHGEAILNPWDFPKCIFKPSSKDNILSNQFDS